MTTWRPIDSTEEAPAPSRWRPVETPPSATTSSWRVVESAPPPAAPLPPTDWIRARTQPQTTPWQQLARAGSALSLGAPAAVNQGVQSELMRLGQASQAGIQNYARPLGDIVRRPLQALNIPTALSAGVGIGTPVNPVLQELEHQTQDIALAQLGNELLTGGGIAGMGALGRRAGEVAESATGALQRRGLVRPEIIRPPATRPARPMGRVVDAEIVTPQRRLPAPATPPSAPAAIPLPAPPAPATIRFQHPLLGRVIEHPVPASVDQVRKTEDALAYGAAHAEDPSAIAAIQARRAEATAEYNALDAKPQKTLADEQRQINLSSGGPMHLMHEALQAADAVRAGMDPATERFQVQAELRKRGLPILADVVETAKPSTGRLSPDIQALVEQAKQPGGIQMPPASSASSAEADAIAQMQRMAARRKAGSANPPQEPPAAPPSPSTVGPMANPGSVMVDQPFQSAIDAYEQTHGAGTFAGLSPKAQMAVIEVHPDFEPVKETIRRVTGMVKPSNPVTEAVALRRLFAREAAVARQAFRAGKTQGRIEAETPPPLTPKQRINQSTGLARPEPTVSEAAALKGSLHRQEQTAREAAAARQVELLERLGKHFSDPRKFLRVAKQKYLTPAQVARIARLQRITPGQTARGPRGGQIEVPLSQADLRRMAATTRNVVPPPGQPTGTPPRIPTGRSIGPYRGGPSPFHDLTEFQASPLSGLEAYRAFGLMDGGRRGPATTGIYEPTLAVTRARADEEKQVLERFTRLVPKLRDNSLEDQALMALGEGTLPPAQVTPRLLRAAAEMRETYDALLERVNAVRVRDGKVPIQRRKDYMPHLRMQTLLSEVFGGFEQIPDDAVNLTLGDIHPNSPYAWFQNRREGGPYAKSAIQAYQRWVGKALEAIHYPEVIRTIKPQLSQLPPRARTYAQAYVDQVLARRAHPIDLIPPPTLLRFIDQQRATTSRGAVSGNLLSFFNQVLTMPATVSSAGPASTTRAILSLSGNAMRRFVSDLAARVGAQTTAQAVLTAQQPDVLNFIEQHSPLIKYRTYDVDFNVKPTAGGRMNPLAAIATAQNAFDVAMVRVAWYANYLAAARGGASQAEAIARAEAMATATNGNFERAALAPLYRSRLAKSATQFTVSINNVLNYLRFDAGAQPTRLLPAGLRQRLNPNPSRNPHTLKQALYFIGTAVALNELIKASHLPIKQTGTADILPGVGIFSGQVPATYALPMAIGQRALARTPEELSRADAALWRAAWLQAPYGNQLRKSLEGLMAVARGGRYAKNGRQLFSVSGPAESARALAFGPYGTKAGKDYIARGFRTAPTTPQQRRINRARGAFRRRLMPSVPRP